MKTTVFLLTVFFIPMAMSADYEREKHWADEIIPSLVIGNPVFLQTGKGPKFLNLYTEAAQAKAAIQPFPSL